ncbi:response regulator [Candidatus Peregrinibacteria bacterium]|nr:response regulator [Candidatus Peregrinibacteria bacterium]
MSNRSKKICIVDDSKFMRSILIGILKSAGFNNFIECENGRECLQICKNDSPDLILLDIIMDGTDGMQVLKSIGSSVNIIVISAMSHDEIMNKAKKLGAKGYIVKPFNQNQVLNEINKIFG